MSDQTRAVLDEADRLLTALRADVRDTPRPLPLPAEDEQ